MEEMQRHAAHTQTLHGDTQNAPKKMLRKQPAWPALCTNAKLSVLEELAYAREAAELMGNCAALVGRCNHHNALPADTACQQTGGQSNEYRIRQRMHRLLNVLICISQRREAVHVQADSIHRQHLDLAVP